MSQTGVLPFVRGIDFDKYNFDDDLKQPKLLAELQRLRWLRCCHTGMTKLPDEIGTLRKLVSEFYIIEANLVYPLVLNNRDYYPTVWIIRLKKVSDR